MIFDKLGMVFNQGSLQIDLVIVENLLGVDYMEHTVTGLGWNMTNIVHI